MKYHNSPIIKGRRRSYIFIHINKTGGTSVVNVVGAPSKKYKRHLTVKEIIDMVGQENFRKAYRFSIVRNPWDKVVSHYNYRTRTNQTKMKEDPIPFIDWVICTYGDAKDGFYYDNPKMFQPQVEWLRDYNGNIAVDSIIKFERLSEGFQEIAKIIGVNGNLPHLNKSSRGNYRNYYDRETINIVYNWFHDDVELFRYKF